MNAYFLDAGEVNFGSQSHYDPPEWGSLVEIVVARSAGAAKYELWRRNMQLLHDLNAVEWKHCWLVQRGVDLPPGPVDFIRPWGEAYRLLWDKAYDIEEKRKASQKSA